MRLAMRRRDAEAGRHGFAGAEAIRGAGRVAAPCSGLWRLLLLGVSAQFGSGWLFAVLQAAGVATG